MTPPSSLSALDRARSKAYWRLLPLLFVCYVIAYVDRANVAIAKLTMAKDMPAFDNAVIGFGAGVFFWGYFMLEVPGSLIVERWGARLWISRIMVTWGIMAAATAFVTTPFQFYVVRFCLGLAEAGFFPGIVVYLTHWFPARDRTRALAFFFVATPVAQIISPKISNLLLKIGTTEIVDGVSIVHPLLFGLKGWQWVYIFWGIPAVLLGAVVFVLLKDKPRDAAWLTPEERAALETQLAVDRAAGSKQRMTLLQALRHPMVLLLSFAYFCNVTANYGLEFFLPSILKDWYNLKLDAITWLVLLPPIVAVGSQLFVGWNSDRTRERRFHCVVPLLIAAVALGLAPLTHGNLVLTVACFMVAFGGLKAYLPAFWAMPNLFLTGPAAAGSIGLINSLGNLGGFFGPAVLGQVQKVSGSFVGGIYYLVGSITLSALVLFFLGLGRRGQEG
jgi:ACS family tartrate transporter-like MFS transporter